MSVQLLNVIFLIEDCCDLTIPKDKTCRGEKGFMKKRESPTNKRRQRIPTAYSQPCIQTTFMAADWEGFMSFYIYIQGTFGRHFYELRSVMMRKEKAKKRKRKRSPLCALAVVPAVFQVHWEIYDSHLHTVVEEVCMLPSLATEHTRN